MNTATLMREGPVAMSGLHEYRDRTVAAAAAAAAAAVTATSLRVTEAWSCRR